MMYKVLVILHLFGAAFWIGGHVVLIRVILPAALRERDPQGILDFERGYGKVGLAALLIQFVTGLWLANTWLGGWNNVFKQSTPSTHLVLAKLILLTATVVLAGHAHRRVLPRLDADRLPSFALHAWATTALAALMLIVGASIRLGGLA